jgi:DNA-binding NtrC family response regulator
MPVSLLIVDDDAATREGLTAALEDKYDVYAAASADEAFELMKSVEFGAVLTDLRMAGKSGLKVIDYALKLDPRPVVVMMTAYGNVETAVEAMRRGATDFLQKPLNLEKLEVVLERALRTKNLEVENANLKARLKDEYSFEQFVGNSPAIKATLEQVKLVSPTKATVLLTGETGTGKELAAQAIHQNSPRADKPFVAVHCAALAENLLESELFGHEKGAFTGAMERRVGRFESAQGGTVFLDEIGEINAATQVKLLRFLETRTIERLGGNAEIKIDVRLIAATNRDLEKMVKEGDFREDLFYRLNVVQIKMPPLKERVADLPELIEFFLGKYAAENGLPKLKVEAGAMEALVGYDWPGNIRELRNLCERWVVTKRDGKVSRADLDSRILGGKGMELTGEAAFSKSANEMALIQKALIETHGNKTKAAELLGISRRTLHRKLKSHE